MKKTAIKKVVNLFYEAGTLRRISRAHKQNLLTNDETDNIASHSFRTTLIGWFLAKAENADPYKVTLMTLFHDIPESRSGDQNWVHKRYVKVFEDEIIKDQIGKLPFEKDLKTVIAEYGERKTAEARIAKDADLLDQILLLKEYAWQGNKEAKRWLTDSEQGKRLSTKTAKLWFKEILIQKPSGWWSNLWTAERR